MQIGDAVVAWKSTEAKVLAFLPNNRVRLQIIRIFPIAGHGIDVQARQKGMFPGQEVITTLDFVELPL